MFNELTKQFTYLLSFLTAPGKVVFTRRHHTQHNDKGHNGSVIMLNVTYKPSTLSVVAPFTLAKKQKMLVSDAGKGVRSCDFFF